MNFIKINKFAFLTFSCLVIYFLLAFLSIYVFLEYFSFLNPNTLNLYSENNFLLFLQKPVLFIIAIIICFVIEGYILKWENNSLSKIINFSSPSARTDVFYMWIKISGLSDFIFNIVFLGFGFYLLNLIKNYSLINTNNIPLEFILMFLCTTFLHYWYHRLMHSKYFWELHKLHHSAAEMNVLTASREHPLVVSVSVLLLSLPVFIFGVRPEIAFIYICITGIYDLFLHSKVNMVPKWARVLMIDSTAHYIHHSTHAHYYNSNYGNFFNIWDRLFKTFKKPLDNNPIPIGIVNDKLNTDKYFKEMFLVIVYWIKSLKRTFK